MAIQLYKEGTSHNVKGVECEVKNFNISELEEKLAEGWVKSPSEIGGETVSEAPIETMESAEEIKETTHPVRMAAKEAGIDGWDTRRIGTLEAELSKEV